MSIELQLTTGNEEWTFNMTESVVPGPGDALTIEDPDGHVRDFRVERATSGVQGLGHHANHPESRLCPG